MTFLGLPLSTFIELLASGVVALGTIFSGLVARQSVVEARKLRQMQDEPRIVVTLWQTSLGSRFLNMWVENTGTGIAYDVKLTSSVDIQFANPNYLNGGAERLSDAGVFASGIPCFPAGHQLAFYIGEMSQMCDNGYSQFTVTATYRNSRKVPCSQAFPLNINSQDGMFQLKTEPLDEIARSLDRMNNTLSKMR